MDYLKELKSIAKSRGIELTVRPNGHIQIHGKLLVNYYPLSKTRTAYIAGTTGGVKNTTPKEAIRMSQKPPKCTDKPAKRKKTKSIKQKLFAKSKRMFLVPNAFDFGTCYYRSRDPFEKRRIRPSNEYGFIL